MIINIECAVAIDCIVPTWIEIGKNRSIFLLKQQKNFQKILCMSKKNISDVLSGKNYENKPFAVSSEFRVRIEFHNIDSDVTAKWIVHRTQVCRCLNFDMRARVCAY